MLRKKFSARTFFSDAAANNVTVVQYIGEVCRYLLNTPVHDGVDKGHKVRIAIGNGLRPEIWDAFQTRFRIPEIGEVCVCVIYTTILTQPQQFYGATESNGALFNHCRTKDAQGACGRLGTLARKMTGTVLAKFDVEEEQPIRDKVTGLCSECPYDEPGELLFPIKPADPTTAFAGYEDKAATDKKIIRDVFVKGDCYFRSGDLLSLDANGGLLCVIAQS